MSNTDPFEPRLRRYLDERASDRPPVGFEERLLRVITNDTERSPGLSLPRQLLAAAAIVALAAGLAIGVAALRTHGFGLLNNGPTAPSGATIKALSIGTQGGGDWVVTRGVNIGPGLPQQKDGNILYHTADGGATWQARLNFTGIYDGISWSPDHRVGVVWTFVMTTPCGATATSCTLPPSDVYTFYSTADSGAHWTQHSPHTFGDFTLVYFRGTDGWVLSRQDVAQGQPASAGAGLYRTTDGGATWSHVSDLAGLTGMQLSGGIWGHVSGVGQTSLEFADAQHGWLATGLETTFGRYSLLETTDGGKTWHGLSIVEAPAAVAGQEQILGYPILLSGGHALLPAFFGHRTDPNNFSIMHRYLYSSSNGGTTWETPPVELKAGSVTPTGDEWQNFYLDANHWWFTATNQRSSGEPVAQAGPAMARTTDGGKSWQVFSGKNAPIILQMTFTDPNNGWAFAIAGPNDTTNVLLRTTDGGGHWHQVQVP